MNQRKLQSDKARLRIMLQGISALLDHADARGAEYLSDEKFAPHNDLKSIDRRLRPHIRAIAAFAGSGHYRIIALATALREEIESLWNCDFPYQLAKEEQTFLFKLALHQFLSFLENADAATLYLAPPRPRPGSLRVGPKIPSMGEPVPVSATRAPPAPQSTVGARPPKVAVPPAPFAASTSAAAVVTEPVKRKRGRPPKSSYMFKGWG